MPPVIPGYPVAANYLLTIIAVCTFFLTLGALTVRLHQPRVPRHSPTLLFADILIFICGMLLCTGAVLLMLSDDEPTTRSLLCQIGGQSLPAALQTYTWIAAMRAFLKLRYLNCSPPSQHVYRLGGGDRCSRFLTIAAIITIAATSGVLGALPVVLPRNAASAGPVTGLKCLPIFPWQSNLHYYSIILFFFCGLGLLYFAIILCILYCGSCRRRRRQRRDQEDLKQNALRMTSIDFLTLSATNAVFVALTSVTEKHMADMMTRLLRWSFLWLAVGTPLVHAVMTLLLHWQHFRRHYSRRKIATWCALPKSFMHVQRLQESKTKWIFRVDWFSEPGVLQKGDLKIFSPAERRQWNNEAYAARKLSRYPHPGLCRYLWLSRSNPYRAVFACLIKEGMLEKGCRLICRQNHDGGELVRFLESNVLAVRDAYHISIDLSGSLRHLKQLRLLHNAISSATVRMMMTTQGGFKPVLTDFEETFEVPVDSLIHHRNERRPPPADQCLIQRPELNEDAIFSSDSRAFGLLMLDMLLSVLRRDGNFLDEQEEESMKDQESTETPPDERPRLTNTYVNYPEYQLCSSMNTVNSSDRQQLVHPLSHSSSVASSVKEVASTITSVSHSDSASRHTHSTALTSRSPETEGGSTFPSRRLRPLFSPTLHHRRYCDYIQQRFPQWLSHGSLLDGDGTRAFRTIRDRLRRFTKTNVKETEEMTMLAVSAWSSCPCVTIEEIDQSLLRIRFNDHNGLPKG